MGMRKLAFLNFKKSFQSYLSLIISLAFTVLVFLNFQNIIYSDSFAILGKVNKNYLDTVVQVISVVLSCFMFFFMWYSTNVFLTTRKKDIGIYVFMGLSNQKIGQMYMIESLMTGGAALILGLLSGFVVSWLFQMIILSLSDIAVDVKFRFDFRSILVTTIVYVIEYMVFVVKGYINIVRSSVLNMLSANKRNEFVRQKPRTLIIKTIIGIIVLGTGFFLSRQMDMNFALGNVLLSVILVICGTYLVFGGLIPVIFQSLSKNKNFLYKKQRNLWMNNMIYRLRKNYRTYAMVSVLILCAVTALSMGFAMRNRYDNINQFEKTYTFQLLSSRSDLLEQAKKVIEEKSPLSYYSYTPVLQLNSPKGEESAPACISYSNVKQLAKDAKLPFDVKPLKDNEVIEVTRLHLMSLASKNEDIEVNINNETYHQLNEISTPYLGYLQERLDFYIVSDSEYGRIQKDGTEVYTYNYQIENKDVFEEVKQALDVFVKESKDEQTGRIAMDPYNNDMDWIKVLYSICIFMFMVFILASGSILFMKLYNDSFEDKEHYLIMQKMGYEEKSLRLAVVWELATAFLAPFLVMAVSSYFSVGAIGVVMMVDLLMVNIVSVGIVFIIFCLCYVCSVFIYQKNIGIR